MRPTPKAPLRAKALRALALATLAVGATAPMTGCSSSPKTDDDLGLTEDQWLGVYLENAFRYLELDEIDRAQDQARRALELDPKNDRFLLIYGRCNLLRGDAQSIQAAIDTFSTIENQEDYRVQMSWGAAVERKGIFYDEAADGVRDGSRATDARDIGARADELAAEARQYWQEAKGRFKRSLDLRSGETEAIGGLVRTTALLGETEESIEWSRELIEAIRATQNLVSLQLDNEEITAERETELFRDRRVNSGFEVKARLHIATLLRQEGRLGEAVEEFDEILLLEPELAEGHSLRAQVLYELGDYARAKASITRFIELKARTVDFEDPSVRKAFNFQEKCDRALRSAGRD